MYESKRILWIDFLKVVGMFLVIWGHSIMHFGLADPMHYDLGCAGWIYTFHMPLFMILSGYVSSKLITGGGNIRRKFEQLIIPCAFCYIIYELIGDTNNLWYLKSLFVCYVLYDWFLRLKGKWRWLSILLFCVFAFPIINKIPIVASWKIDWMFPFFGIGLLLNYYSNWIKKHLRIVTVVSLIGFAILLFLFENEYIYYFSPSRWFDYRAIWKPDIHFLHIKSILPCIYRYLVGTAGSLSLISIGMIMENRGGKFGSCVLKLSKYGRYSLHLFILQNLLFMTGHHFNFALPCNNVFLYSFVLCPLLSAVQTVFYVLLSKVLEKSRYINQYIFGQLEK